ncbi:uncharacterized protein J7T54_006259 [Emericellopsis cladophorae]|uniref:Major facilitator superfamily (MFS) profile domain-containing protein n=1 Tax=Emericellopsis cladophorae TaxID=2686198 RepID=A0A9P9Y9N9_9HYPO|nr:uncharacterized protein J7T54_006259 [Emericellopsis cladophorae]KAI6785920.1 hypothetical protein J7T54_006259 [Emericellopsis cladophorae]
MCLHFMNQFGNTKAVPSMLITMQSWGFFAFFTAVPVAGIVFVWFFVPEMAGRSLESTDALFALPWWKVGRYGAKLTPDTDPLSAERDGKMNEDEKNGVQTVEYGQSAV